MKLVTTRSDLDEVVAYFQNDAEYMCFDVETLGDYRGDPWRNVVAWISLGDSKQTFVIPCGHPNGEFVEHIFPLKESEDLKARLARGLKPRKSDYSVSMKLAQTVFTEPPDQLDRTTVFGALKPLFFSDILKVGQNLSFDLGSVAKYLGDIPAPPYADTMIAAFLVDSSRSFGYGLQELTKRYTDMEIEKGVGKEIEKHTFTEVAKYSGLDVVATSKIWDALQPRLDAAELRTALELEMDVLPIVVRMRLRGADVDRAALEELQSRLATDSEKIRGNIYRIAKRKFNVNSTAEKQRILYSPKSEDGRGLKGSLLTPTGQERKRSGEPLRISDYAVSAEALEQFRGRDALVDELLNYALVNKLLSTYVTPYLPDPKAPENAPAVKKNGLLDKGRVHTELVQIGAATGRFSSRNPNLQNIPAPHTEYGKQIRNLFIAPKGHQMIVADYSQIEPRIVAMLSHDPTMVSTYKDGGDIYTAVGERMGVDRKAGKVLVLSITYGVGPSKISQQIGCSEADARDLLDAFSDQFPKIIDLKNRVVRIARDQRPIPFVETMVGRRRYLPDLQSKDRYLAARAARQAFNTRIQGSAADVMKMAMVDASLLIPEAASLILSVHDEIVAVAPDDLVEETTEAIRAGMEDRFKTWRVPLVADVKVVKKWGDAK
jgi:DNA polymerase I-like protein with 3'-5' exonuclease and polymerase domains